jgi:protein-tyrosine phosphatase
LAGQITPPQRKDRWVCAYQLTWITEQLAAGHAPFCHEDLETIKALGIDAIVNLCGEYCDLHEIEQGSGFSVFYLPIADACAPDMGRMEEALVWVEQKIAQGHKTLVHCRFGVGRTGTFISAFLMRSGMDLKTAEKVLKRTRATPSNYCQWKLLRQYGKTLKKRRERKD